MAMRNVTITFTKQELRDLAKAWVLLSLAFAILFAGLSLSTGFLVAFLISGITVGIGFLLHELAHKFTALHYGCEAHFKANNTMLLIAVALSFFGFVFAAPGAVWFSGHTTRKQRGHIAAAGPLANIILAALFLPLLGTPIGNYGAGINAFLALFNMLPLPGLDGEKVLSWDKGAYAALLIVAGVLSFLFYF